MWRRFRDNFKRLSQAVSRSRAGGTVGRVEAAGRDPAFADTPCLSGRAAIDPSSVRSALTGRRGQRGFTLIEALVALGVLAATIALVNRTFASGWSAVRHGSLESRAIAIAKARLEATGTEIPLAVDTAEGQQDGMRWRREISLYDPPGQTAGATARLPAWWVRVDVAWRDTPFAAERVIALTTIRHGPTRP